MSASGGSTSTEEIRRVVSGLLPGFPVDTVDRLGEGQEHVAFEVNGELVVRFAKDPDPKRGAERVRREHDVLAAVADASPLPVPRPEFFSTEPPCIAHLKLPGIPLLETSPPQRWDHAESIATRLGEFLTAMHAVPLERMALLVAPDDQPLEGWQKDAVEDYEMIAGRIPAMYRGPIESFLHVPPPPGDLPLVFSHNDLGIEHVLVDPDTWAITGIIDWSDAALVDRAFDFGLLYRDLGPGALDAALRAYRSEFEGVVTLDERARFYARCSVFEELVYGVGKELAPYVDKSLAAMDWLFKP